MAKDPWDLGIDLPDDPNYKEDRHETAEPYGYTPLGSAIFDPADPRIAALKAAAAAGPITKEQLKKILQVTG